MSKGEGLYPAPTNKRINELDARISAMQKGTRALVPAVVPLHDILRQKFRWYKRWSSWPAAKFVNMIVLFIYIAGASYFGINSLVNSHKVLAAHTACTWTNGGANNIWNNAANWSCGNVPNNTNDVIFNGATSNANITIDVAATAGSFTTTGAVTGGGGASGQAAVMNTGAQLNFTSNAANVTVNSTTGIFSGYAWLDDAGWVAFGTADNAVDGPVTENTSTGAVTGKAKILNDGTLIDFNASPYNSNVVINTTTGQFSGYAWSDSLGWIDFTNVKLTSAYTGTITANFGLTTDISQGGSGDFTLGGGTYTANATNISVAGNYARTGGTFTAGTGTITMTSTSTGKTFTAGGQTYNNITFNGVGGGWSLLDSLTTNSTSATVTLTQGTLHTDGVADNLGLSHNWWKFATVSGTKTLNLGNSTITITGTGTAWNFNNASATLNEGTSELIFTAANVLFSTSSETYYDVTFSGSGLHRITNSNTFNNLTRTGTAVQTDILEVQGNQIVNGVLTLTGNSAINRLLVNSNTIGTPRTITLGASATMASVSNYVDFMDITVTGGAANERDFQTNAKSAGDCGGNTGITFTTAAPQTWNGTTGNWSTAGLWTSRIPLPQDNVIIPDPGAAFRSLAADMPRLGRDITVTNTNAANQLVLTLNNQDNTIYGSLTLVSSAFMQIYNNKALIFAGRNACTLTTAGQLIYNPKIATFGGSLTQLDAASYSYFYVVRGTYNTNNYTLTAYWIKDISSDAITINFGTSNIICNESMDWTGTNTIVNGANATINMKDTSSTARTIKGSANSAFGNIIITPGPGILTFSGAFTFANMTMASAGTKTVKFNRSTTYTMTGNNFLSGSGTGNITVNSDDGATAFTLSKTGTGIISSDYLTLDRSTATQTNTFYAGANSIDGTHNTNWLFTVPPVPTAPTIGTAVPQSATSMRWVFTDNANSEDGFKVYDGSNTLKATCVGVNFTYCDETGLSVNTLYNDRYVVAYNATGDSAHSGTAAGKYTLVNTPTAPTIVAPSSSSLTVIVGQNGNPAGTTYEIQETSTGNYVQADGTLGAGEVYQTYPNWGGGAGKVNSGLTAATQYTYQVKAKNGDAVAGSFSSTASQTTLTAGDTISGSLYSDLGVTKISAAKTIHASINGGAASTTTSSSGDFTINLGTTLNANDIITVFVSGDAGVKASTVTKVSATGNLTGINLYQNYTIIRHEGSISQIINGDLATADNLADSDELFSVDGANKATYTQGLYILSTKTYLPSGSVTTTNANIAGTLDLASSGYILELTGAGTPLVIGGTFTCGTNSTVKYTAASNTNITATTYNNLITAPGASMSNFTVSGAGTSAYNGIYTAAGTWNGDPYYTNGSYALYRATNGVGQEMWRLWTDALKQADSTPAPSAAYFGQISADLPANAWMAGIGAGPAPLVTSGYTFASGTVTVTGNYTNGDGTHAVVTTADINDPAISISGNFVNSASATFVASNSGAFNIAGNYTNSGTFTNSSGGMTLNGSAAQSFTAGGVGAGYNLYNLTAANTSGNTLGITFIDSLTLDTGGRFTDTTQDSKLTFNNNSTYTFPLITITGATGHNILMTKSAGANKWMFNVAQVAPTVTYVTPTNSNATASPAGPINDTTGGVDGGGNTNWNFGSVVPNAPTIGAPGAQSATSIRWNFTDNASNETGFKVYDSSDVLKATCASANLTYCDETGLGVNTQYTGRYVVAYNGNGNSAHSGTAASIYTLANTPSAPTVNATSSSSLTVFINENGNSPMTNYSIQETTTGKYIQADGTLNTTEVYQIYALWPGSGIVNTGLTAATQYTYQVKAKNGDNITTAFSPTASQTTLAVGNTISGSLYSDLGVTKIGAAETIHVSVNGGAAVSGTTSGGDFTVTTNGTLNANDIITVFVSGDAGVKASTVTKVSAGGNLTGINLYQNYTIIRHEGSIASILNTDLATADNLADADELFSVDGLNKATFTQGVYILTGKTYAPTGDVSVANNWDSSAGTFTPGSSTVDLTGTGTLKTKSLTTTPYDFYNLKIAHNGQTTTNQSTIYVNNITNAYSGGTISGSGLRFMKSDGDPFIDTGATINVELNYYSTTDITVSGHTTTSDIYYRIGVSSNVTYSLSSALSTSSNIFMVGSSTYLAKLDTSTFGLSAANVYLGLGSSGGGLILGSGTHTISGNLTIYSGETAVNNTLDLSSSNTSVAGNIDFTGITVTPGSSTLDMTKAGASTQTLKSAAQPLFNLKHSGSGVLSLVDALNVDGYFNQTATAIRGFNTNGQAQSYAGDFTLATGTTFTKGGTVTFDGTTTYTDSTATPQNIGVVVVDGTTTLASNMTVDKMTINNTKTLNLASSGYTLKLANAGAVADVLTVTGTLNPGTNSIVQYTATNSGGNINVPATTYHDLKISGAESYNLTGSLTGGNAMTGNLTIDANATLNTYVSTTSYDISCVNVTVNTSGTLYAGIGSTSGTSTITASGSFYASVVTFTYGKSTVNLTGTGSVSAETNFYNLTLAAAGQTTTLLGNAWNYEKISNLLTTGTGTLTGASVRLNAQNITPFVNGGANITGLGHFRYVGVNQIITSATYGSLELAGDALTATASLGGDITATDLSIWSDWGGQFTMSSNNHNIIATSLTVGVLNMGSGNLTVNGNVTIGAPYNGYHNILDLGSGTHSIAGNFANSDTLTAGSSTVNFTKATGTQTLNSGGTAAANTFNNVTHSGAGTLQLITNDLKASGNFTNSAGTFDTNARDITVGGNVDLTGGSFTQGTGRINLNGAAAQSFTAGGTGAGHTPYNITTTNASAAGLIFTDSLTLATGGTFTDTTQDSKITFNDNSTYTFPNILINGASSHNIIMTKNAGVNKWLFNVPGTPTVTYVTADHSDATGSGAAIDDTTGGLDANNNINWNFGAVAPNAPTLPTQNVDSATQITFGWTDNSSNETGFKVYVSTTANADCSLATYPGSPNYTTAADATSQSASSLDVNTQYCGKITATNANGDSTAIYTAPKYTLANTPVAPTVNTVYGQPTQLQMIVGVNGNSAPTQFAIQETVTSGNKYVQADGSLNTSAVWQTYAQWGSGNGTTVTGLTAATQYTFQVKAQNGDNTATAFGTTAQQTTVSTGNTISGSLYSDLGVTKINTAKTIKVSINGLAATSASTSAGDFTVTASQALAANDIITVFVSGDAGTKASTVTKVSASGNLNGIDLYQNYTTIRHEGSITEIAHSDIVTARGLADTDELMSCTGRGCGVDVFTQGLYIFTGKTYNVGIDIVVAGSWNNAGTFTQGTYMVGFNGTATGKTINPGASSFYNLTFIGSGGAWSPLTNTVTVANELTMTAGTFDTSNGTANVTVNGNIACGGACGTINMTSTNTFTQNVAVDKAFGTSATGTTAWTFNNLTFSSSTGTPTITTSTIGTGDITVNGVLNIAANTTFDAGNRTYHLMGSGTPLTSSGTFAYGTSTVSYENTSSATITKQEYYNLQTNPASGTPAYDTTSFSNSFLAGTQVLTDNGSRNIEDLIVDDKVMSYDLNKNETVVSKVTALQQGTRNQYYKINNKIKVTDNHSFFLSDYSQKKVRDLQVGDILKSFTGTEAIQSIELINQDVTVYDIEVDIYHLFFAENILVHNPVPPPAAININNNFTMTGSGNSTLTAMGGFTIVNDFSIGSSQVFLAPFGSSSLALGGNFTNAGTYTHRSGAVIFDGNSSGKTINIGTSSFYDLILSGSGAWSPLTNTVTVTNNLTMTNGTFDTSNGTADVTVNGNVQCGATCGTINMTSTNTFTQNVAADKAFSTSVAGTTAWTFNNLTFSSSTGTPTITTSTTGSGDITVGGTLTIAASTTLNAGNRNWILTGSTGSPFAYSGALSGGTSTFQYKNVNGAGNVNVVTAPYKNLRFTPVSAESYNLTGSLTSGNAMTGDLTIDANATLNTYGGTTSYDLSCTNVTVNASGILYSGVNGTSGTSTFNVSGNWDHKSGTFTYGKSTVNLTGSGDLNISNTKPVYNLTCAAGSYITNTSNSSSSTPVQGVLTVGTGTISGSKTVELYGGGTPLVTSGATLSAEIDYFSTSYITATTYSILGVSGDTTSTLVGDITATTLKIAGNNAGTMVLATANHNITATSLLLGSAGLTRSATLNLGSGTMTVNGDVTINTPSATYHSTLNLGSGTLNISGNYVNGDILSAGTSTVNFTKATGTQTLNSGGTAAANTFNNVMHSGAGTLQLVTNDLTASGNFTNSAGIFDTNARDITVGGNVDLTGGIFTQGTGRINLNGAAAQQFTAGGTGVGHTPYNITTTNASAAGLTLADSLTLATGGTFTDTTQDSKITFNDNSIYTFPNILINGATGHNIILTKSAGANKWLFNVPGTPTVTYVTADHSDATGSGAAIDDTTGGLDANNNINWNFGAVAPNAPTLPTQNVDSATQITFGWTDNSSNETDFKVYVSTLANADCSLATYPGSPNYTTAANAVTQAASSLGVNSQYCGKITATNANGDSTAIYTSPKYTLANTPVAPTVNTVYGQPTQLQTIVGVNGNPAPTQFAIQETQQSGLKFVQVDGSLNITPIWQTYAQWGSGTGTTVTGLTAATQYTFQVKAQNGDNTATAFGTTAQQTTVVNGNTISGSLYSDLGTTKINTAKTIKVSVNGNAAASAQSSSGDFTVTANQALAANDIITVFVSGDAGTKASTVTKVSATGNLTGINLYQNYTIIRHEGSIASISNADLNTAGGLADVDELFSTSSNNTTFTQGLYIWTGKTYAPAGNVNVSGNWTNNGGTFTIGTGTVTFNGTGTQTINGTLATQTFYNLVVAKTAGQTLNTGGSTTTLTINNNFTETTGNFTAPATFNVTGNLSVNAGTISLGANLNLGGNLSVNSGVSFSYGTGTITFNGTGSQSITFGLPTISFSNIVVAKTAGQLLSFGSLTVTVNSFTQTTGNFSFTNSLTVNGNLLLSSGTFTSGTNLYVKGNFTNNGATFTPGTNTVTFNGNSTGKTINVGASGFYTMTVNGAGGGWTLASNLTTIVNLNITLGTLATSTFNLGPASGSATITVNGGTLTGGSGIINTRILTVSSGTFTAGNTVTVGYRDDSPGSYTHSGGIVDWLTNSTSFSYLTWGSVNVPADVYYNLELKNGYGNGDEYSPTFNLLSDTSVTGNLSIAVFSLGPTTLALSDKTLTVAGNVSVATHTIISMTSGVLQVGGDYSNSGTLTPNTGTVEFTKASGTQTLNSGGTAAPNTFNNLTHSGAGILQLITNNINIDGNLTNSNGIFDANGLNVNVAKNWNISGGSFSAGGTPGTQTVTFDSTNAATVSGSTTFNNLTMDSSVDGAKQINFAAGSTQTISAGKTWTLNGAAGKVLTLRSTVDTSAWKFVIPADFTAGTYVDVKDSQNTTNAYRITPGANTTDSGNNTPGWNFLPKVPTIGTPTALSATSIRWNFTDTADNETGFKVYDASDVLKATCVGVNLTYCDETGLSVNTEYTGRYVVAYNAIGNSAHSGTAASIYTLANTPAASTLGNVTGQTTQLIIAITAGDSNPANTTYALYETSTGQYLQADGTLGVSAIYQTVAIWGIKTITGLNANTNYTFEVKAKNGNDIATAFSTTSSKYTLIETPTGITFGAVNDDSIVMSASGSLANLTSGSSGLQFTETSGNTGSGGEAGFTPLWTNANSVTDTGLALGIQYSYKVKARNGDGTETVDTSIFNQTTTSSGLTAPSNVTLTVDMTTQLTAHWADNSASETGFKVYVSTVANTDCSLATFPGTPNYTTVANATSRFLPSLGVNTQYCAKIIATTGLVDSSPAYAAAAKYTFANIPTAPTVAAASSTSLNTLITQTGNPAWTQYTIYNSTLNQYVQANGSTSGTAMWQTYAQWGGDSGMNNTGLGVNKRYNYQITAQNGDGVTGNGGDPIEDCTTNINVANAGDSAFNGDYILAGSFNTHSYYTYDAAGTMMALWSGQVSPGHYIWRLSQDSAKVTSQSAPASFPYYGSAGTDDPLPAMPWNVGTGVANAPSLLCGQSGTYTASAYTFANTPSAPTVAPVSVTSLNSIINVNANPSYTEFAIYNATDNKYVQANGTLAAGAVWQNNAEWNAGSGIDSTGLKANTAYNYEIRVRNMDNLETSSPQLSAGTSKYTLIETPTAVSFDTLSSTSIAMHSFNTPSHLADGSSGLIFTETSGNANGGGEACFTNTTSNTCTDTGLAVNVQYTYKVKAQNGDGVQTADTAVINKFTLANTPGALGVDANYNETDGYFTTLTLHAAGNPDGTEYQINTDAFAPQNDLATVKKTALTCNQSYAYHAIARNGDGVETNLVADVSDTTPLCSPQTLSETDLTATSSVLNWDVVAGIDPVYDISFGKDVVATDLGVTSNIADATLAQGALDPATTYYYKVRAHNVNGTGAWSAVKNFLTHNTSNQLLITLPGQSFVAGTGLVGTPNHQTAGVPFTANIVAVDTDLQVTPDYNHQITFSAPTDYLASTYGSTSNAGAPAQPATLVAGQKEVTFTLYQAKPQIISASGSSGASADFIVDPGQTSAIKSSANPDSQTLPTTQTALITVNLKDNFGNNIAGHNLAASSNQVGDNALALAPTNSDGNTTISVSTGLAHTSILTITDTTSGVVINPRPQVIFTPSGSACAIKPSSPSNLRATEIGSTNLSLAWDESVAACELKTYEIFNAQTGIKVGETKKQNLDLTGLAPVTSYSFFVIARDKSDNTSDPSNTLIIKTLKGNENAPVGNVCHAGGGEVAFLILGNTPEQVTAGQVFPNDVIVKVMVADGGGALCDGYRGATYFDSTDKKAVLAWTASHEYNFSATDAGQHSFSGSDFKLYTVGDQTLTVTDKAVSGKAEIKVLSSRIIFQKAQNTITNFLGRNSMRVNTAVVATTTILLLAPLMVNLIIALSNFIPQIIYWLTQLLQMLGLRKKRKPWGVIFNSQTGQPVSLAVVKIFDREYHRQLESTVTDKQGRFGFLVRPGTFYLTISKTGFVFPSQFKISEFFENVYAGGNLKIDAKSEKAVTMNVPIDPQARASVIFALWVNLIKLNRFLQKIRLPLMAAGTIFAVIMIISAYHIIYALSLVLYGFLFVLEIFQAKKSRPYGVVSDVFGNPLELSIVRIYSKKTNRLIATDVTDAQGRFKFLVNPGIFYLMTAKPGYLDFKSHIMYLEGERTMVTVNIKLKKVEKHLLDKNEKLRSW